MKIIIHTQVIFIHIVRGKQKTCQTHELAGGTSTFFRKPLSCLLPAEKLHVMWTARPQGSWQLFMTIESPFKPI